MNKELHDKRIKVSAQEERDGNASSEVGQPQKTQASGQPSASDKPAGTSTNTVSAAEAASATSAVNRIAASIPIAREALTPAAHPEIPSSAPVGDYGFFEPAPGVVDQRFSAMQALKDSERQRWGYRALKRTFDICFSGAVIAVGLLPGLALAAAIRLESPGNPFYSQERVGRTHRDGSVGTFRMWKFRSMYQDADARLAELLEKNEVSGAMFKMKDDPRVTRIGRFIRRHSIDEFPQFVNVFLGQMSVVGPRPPLARELPAYASGDLGRLAVKPGLTGPWQVGGRSDLDFDDMVALDLDYIEKRSVLLDLKIVLKTIAVVFTGEGAA